MAAVTVKSKKRSPPAPRSLVRRGRARRVEDSTEPQKTFDIKDNRQLRWLAGLHYATSLTGTSVAEMSRTDPFTMVSHTTLDTWAREDRWIEKQRRYRDQIGEKIRARLGDEQVRYHLQMLRDMQGVYTKVVELLHDENAPKPKSFESLVTVYTKLVLAIGEIRRDVVGFVAPRPGIVAEADDDVPASAPQMVPEISDDEARIAAEAILRQRMMISDGGAQGDSVGADGSKTTTEEER